MHPLRISGIVIGFGILVAAFLPWMTVSGLFGGASSTGVSGDGKFTLIGGIAIGVLIGLWKRATAIAASVVSGLVALISVVGLLRIVTDAAAFGVFGSWRPGVGLILTVLLSIGAVIVSVKSISITAKAEGTAGMPLFSTGRPAQTAYPTATARPPMTAAPPPAAAPRPAVAPAPAAAPRPAVAPAPAAAPRPAVAPAPPAPPPAPPAPPAPPGGALPPPAPPAPPPAPPAPPAPPGPPPPPSP